MSGEKALQVFVSYAHEDEAHLKNLTQHLASFKRDGQIETWHDREITAGEAWRGQLDHHLDSADLILLLVSPSFIASDYCYDVEATRALERNARGEARVVPILLRPCRWEKTPFAALQGLPKDLKPITQWGNRDAAWLDVARGLETVIEAFPRKRLQKAKLAEPHYPDGESRSLSLALKKLYGRRKTLTVEGGNTRAIDEEILNVRRTLRKGLQLRPGEFLDNGRYELFEAIGQGGFATVWRAWDEETENLVAIKVLHGQYAHDQSRRDRFFRGARKMSELSHPHIVRVLRSRCADDECYFYVMEYLAGGNFEKAILSNELSPNDRLEALLEVGEALAYAHSKDVVHRDVKPSNILLDAENRAKLTDFDLVRANDTSGLTRTQAMMGTIHFAAPEALMSAADAGPAADVYSLGSTAVFAISGCRLPGFYYLETRKVIDELECNAAVKEVLVEATARKPSDRPGSVREFCKRLKRAAVERPRRRGSHRGVPPSANRSRPQGPRSSLRPAARRGGWPRPEAMNSVDGQGPNSGAST